MFPETTSRVKRLFRRLLARRHSRFARTSKLYVLRVDFPIKEEIATSLEQSLQPLRDKFGLDFVVLEPGMHLSRFDDI